MFIDGLDEFEGREDTVIKHMTDLADQEHVKVCLSSRPSPIFEEAFNGRPSLRLQDLTFHTIRGYAKKQLSPQIQKRASLNKKDGDLAEELFTRIVERADGVFLWAIIVIRDVSDGLRGFADLNELTQAIEHLPSELESLYIRMLHRIKSPFKRDAAYFLKVALYQDNNIFNRMDLCRLHFSRSNRERKDAPFSYEEIATNELVEKCRNLETGLRSHTVGLLELARLNPPLHHPLPYRGSHPQFRFYRKWEDHDPILSTKIAFLHRTTRDFLLENDDAKSFLAQNGLSEAHVRLSIARGTLAQLAHFSQGEAKFADDEWPHPILYPYHGALSQISKAERLFGAAQARLMRSLDYESWARGYLVADRYGGRSGRLEAYMVEDPATLIDVVGMAAAVGMTFYVCEQLDLKVQSRCGSFSLPDLNKYSGNRATAVTLSWSGGNQIRDIVTGSATRSPSSKYRQGLGECLQWKADDQPSSPTDFPSKKHLLAESYILSCCRPACLDLVRVLLTAGANPMVRVEPKPVGKHAGIVDSFWTSWLEYLYRLHIEHLKPTGKSPGFLLDYEGKNMHVTVNDIFDVTKGLLAQGADINYQMEFFRVVYLKRRCSLAQELGVSMRASAMFLLEEYFNAEPEFRKFAIEMELLIERPTRKIHVVQLPEYLYRIPKNYKVYNPCPCAKECDILWPLIEKWDDSGSRDDLDALKAAVVEVWRAHNPGVKLRKWHGHERDYYKIYDDEGDGDDESDDDDESDSDDEFDGDDEGDGDDEDVDDDKKHNDNKKNDEVDDKKDESPST